MGESEREESEEDREGAVKLVIFFLKSYNYLKYIDMFLHYFNKFNYCTHHVKRYFRTYYNYHTKTSNN